MCHSFTQLLSIRFFPKNNYFAYIKTNFIYTNLYIIFSHIDFFTFEMYVYLFDLFSLDFLCMLFTTYNK